MLVIVHHNMLVLARHDKLVMERKIEKHYGDPE